MGFCSYVIVLNASGVSLSHNLLLIALDYLRILTVYNHVLL